MNRLWEPLWERLSVVGGIEVDFLQKYTIHTISWKPSDFDGTGGNYDESGKTLLGLELVHLLKVPVF